MTRQYDLQSAIKQSGKKPDEIAQHLGVRPETLHRWVCGRAKMPAHLIAKMRELESISVDTRSAVG
jgi:hypothetical protein